MRASHGNQSAARAYVTQLYKNVRILDSGARGSTVTFTQRHVGDVLLAWENEADLIATTLGRGQYDIVYPSVSILAEPPVAVVDKNVAAHGTRPVATAYFEVAVLTDRTGDRRASLLPPFEPGSRPEIRRSVPAD